jgi:DNA polymerase-4
VTAPDSTGCTILHVDMDAFYVAVGIRDRPELQGLPVVAGGGDRGVVVSASYAARQYGIRSAMPITRARRLCPQVISVHPDFDEVNTVSTAIMETFRSVTPLVEALSMDEAFLDVRGAMRRYGSALAIGEYLRAKIADEQRVTCSVGISTTTQLAKLASRQAKPDGLVVVPPDEVTAFLHPLAVDELWGVGEKTAEQLHRLGLRTVGDLAHTPRQILCRAMGHGLGTQLHLLAWGESDRPVTARRSIDEPDHSIGSDETFGRDTDDPAVIARELLRLSHKVAARIRAAGMVGRTVVLKLRFSDFTTITRSRTLRDPTCLASEIYETALTLFAALGLQRARLRLVGVRVQGLVDAATATRQLMLGARPYGWEEAEDAIDRANYRFGHRSVVPATLLKPDHPRVSA